MKQRNQILSALLLAGLSVHAFASLQATLDRDQMAQGETVQLSLQHDGSDGDPNLTPLKQDFEIVGTSQGTSIQIANGHLARQAQVQVILSPKHAGKITIPPLQWGNDRSQILVLNVDGSSGNSNNSNNMNNGSTGTTPQNNNPAASSDDSHVFIESTVNQNQPYVQGSVILTIRIFTDQPINQAGLDFPANNDVLVKQLGTDTQSTETRNGHPYQVVQRQYLLTPQRSGALSLNGPVFMAEVADVRSSFNTVFGNDPFAGMVTSSRPIRLQGKPILLNVRPRPVDANGHDLLPAAQLSLQEKWQPNKLSMATGEPLTRHLHLVATGLAGNSLPDLSALMSLPDGIKAYPDQAKYSTDIQDGKIISSSDQDIALIANRPGHFELPAVKLSWWDTTQNTQREVTLPARSIEVTGAAISANATPATPAQIGSNINTNATHQNNISTVTKTSSLPWFWISLALFGLWIITLLAWWWDHRKLERNIGGVVKDSTKGSTQDSASQKTQSKKVFDRAKSAKAFQQACYANDPTAARLHLLAWATDSWPKNPPSGINILAQQLGDPKLTPLLEQLDRACYSNVEWQGEALALALTTLPAATKTKKAHLDLDRLYPD
jgi:hypothetical protein